MMKIADFCKTAAGGTPLKNNKLFYTEGNIPWLLSGEVGQKNITETKNFITQAGLDRSSAKIFPVNSILIAMYGATAGEVGILRCNASTNQAVCAIYPNEKVIPEYLYYFFLNHKELLVAQAVGNAQPNISQQKIKNTEIDLPLISEQKRIVSILDQAFADIEQARAKTEQNLENARELFESYLQQVFSQHGDGWKKTQLGNLFDIGSSKRIYATDWKSSGVPFFGGKEIVQLAKYGTVVSNAYISEEKYIEYASKYDMPQEGDILMTARGTIGVGYIVKKEEKFYYKDGNIISLRQKVPTNPQFILYAFKSKKIVAQIEMLTGTTVNHLPLKTAKEIFINVPNNHEQDLYVSQIKKMEFNIQQLVCTYEKKLLSIDELKKSILQNAFMGKLTKAGKPYENANNVGNRQN